MSYKAVLTKSNQRQKPRLFRPIIATLATALMGSVFATHAMAATCNLETANRIIQVHAPRPAWNYLDSNFTYRKDLESTRGHVLTLSGSQSEVLWIEGNGWGEINARNLTGNLTVCVTGGAAVDVIAGTGVLYFSGGEGADFVMASSASRATIYGRGGNDLLIGSNSLEGMDLIFGGDGNDFIAGGKGLDGLFGEGGADFVTGGSPNQDPNKTDGDDIIDGGDGEDILTGGAGYDVIVGGTGRDLIALYALKVNAGSGAAQGQVTGFVTDEFFLRSSWVLADTNDTDGGEVDGNGSGDTIHGSDGADEINGGSGDDIIFGYGGNDSITGSTGRDEIHGGDGNDTLTLGYWSATPDRIMTNGARDHAGCLICGFLPIFDPQGFILDTSGGAIWGDGGDDDIYGSNGNDGLNGGSGHDVLLGYAGNDNLSGGTASDVLYGGTGLDLLFGEGSPDTCYQADGGSEGCLD